MEQINNGKTNVSQALVGPETEKKITYKVGEEEVTLTRAVVRNYLTRGASGVTDAEIVQFMALCQANKLNPFVGDAYLVKYQGSPAQMITAKDAFMKRAETGPAYEGFTAGVIVLRKNEVVELEGSFFLPTDTLVGGWCRVFRTDRAQPFTARVALKEYHTGKSTWAQKPGTMIRKVAIAQAFREAYPVNLGGLYTPEEEAPEDQAQTAPAVPSAPANSQPVALPPEEAVPEPQDEREPEWTPEPLPAPVMPAETGENADFNADLFNPETV